MGCRVNEIGRHENNTDNVLEMFGFEEKKDRLVSEEGGVVKGFLLVWVLFCFFSSCFWLSWFFTGREH